MSHRDSVSVDDHERIDLTPSTLAVSVWPNGTEDSDCFLDIGRFASTSQGELVRRSDDRARRGRCCGADTCATADARDEKTFRLKGSVGLGDGARGHAKIAGELAHRGQALLSGKNSGGYESADLILDLVDQWGAGRVQGNDHVRTDSRGWRIGAGAADRSTPHHMANPRMTAMYEPIWRAGPIAANEVPSSIHPALPPESPRRKVDAA
jgi:hypothetical protein